METREIKFRGLKDDISNCNWVYGWYCINVLGEDAIQTTDSYRYNTIHTVLKGTICQFTGLKDKNGTECYDGDIVSHDSYGRGYVEWDNDSASFTVWFGDSKEDLDWHFLPRVIKECKIVSTIHQKP